MDSLKLAATFKVVETNGSRHIQLYDKAGNKLDGDRAYWDGNFLCSYNNLTSLVGAPSRVNGGFSCHNNNLTSLEGAPSRVYGDFFCHNNNLTSLVGAPSKVYGGFNCHSNNLTSLEGAPSEVNGSFYCSSNNVVELEANRYYSKELDTYYEYMDSKIVTKLGRVAKTKLWSILNG